MMHDTLGPLLFRHAPAHGTVPTPIPGLELIRVTQPLSTVPSLYPASLCLLVQGEKRVYFGGQAITYGRDRLLCCTMPMPVKAEVPQASPEAPVLGLLLRLDTQVMMETLVAAEATGELPPAPRSAGPSPGLVVAPWDPHVVDSLSRLAALPDDPCARQVLVSARLREVYFAVLRSEAGQAVRRICRHNQSVRGLTVHDRNLLTRKRVPIARGYRARLHSVQGVSAVVVCKRQRPWAVAQSYRAGLLPVAQRFPRRQAAPRRVQPCPEKVAEPARLPGPGRPP